jgi:uncharacterized protein (TIGR00369 family)
VAAEIQPPDPRFRDKVLASFAKQGLMLHLGAEITVLEPGRCEITVTFRPELTQQHGYFHAGVSGAIADSAAGYAAFSLAPAESNILTVEYKLNLVAPAAGETLVARGRVERAGRTLTVCRSDVYAIRGGEEKLCATSLSTMMIVPAGEN